jgi:hypothetical protein
MKNKGVEKHVKIPFSRKQYEYLLKVLYLGNWMINAHRTDKGVVEYRSLENHIYSFCRGFGMEHLVEYDEEMKEYFPSRQLEESPDVERFREEYDNETFWGELIERLARRDLIEMYGEEEAGRMALEEIMEREQPLLDRYEMEFSEHGVDNLEIRERAGGFELKGNA